MNWGEFRDMIRATLLQDNVPDEDSGEFRQSDEEILMYMRWALETFAQHTAVATATSIPVANGYTFTMPDNVYDGEELDNSIQVIFTSTSGKVEYVDPVRYTDGVNEITGRGFYSEPKDTLNLSFDPLGGSLLIRYYAYWPEPTEDSDPIYTPRWANTALSYLVAAHALSGAAKRSAGVRQWGAKPDTGNPEHNPIQRQAEAFFKKYECEIGRHDPQNRVNYQRQWQN